MIDDPPVSDGPSSPSEKRCPAPAPRWLIALGSAVLLVTAAMSLLGAVRLGINSDEPVHLLRLESWFEAGWYLPWFYMDGSQPAASVTDAYVYAPVAMLIAHGAAVFVGAESWGQLAASPEAYAVRHVTFAIHGLVGIVAAGLTVRLITGSWRWAVLGAAMLSAIPLWTGHAMFNVKDTPVATGVAVTTLALVMMSRPRFDASWRVRSLAGVTFGLGIFLAMGVRPGIWPVIALCAAGLLVAKVLLWNGDPEAGSRWSGAAVRVGTLAAGAGGAYAALIVVAPKHFVNPVRLLRASVSESADFVAWDGWIITSGIGHGTPPPWWYLPAWIANQIPILILVLAVIGVALVPWCLVRRRTQRRDDGPRRPRTTLNSNAVLVGVTVVALQATAAPIASVVTGARLQSGIRQLLFVIPSVAVLAAIGAWAALGIMGDRSGRRSMLWSRCISVTCAGALVLPTIDQVRLFPYNYVYFNEISILREVDGRWATDYLRTSFREIATKVGPDGEAICSAHSLMEDAPTDARVDADRSRGFWACHSFASFAAFVSDSGHRGAQTPIDPGQFWLVRENQFGYNVPNNCTFVDEITRPLRHRTVMLSYVAVCDPTVPDP